MKQPQTCPRCVIGELVEVHDGEWHGLVCLVCRSSWWTDRQGHKAEVKQ